MRSYEEQNRETKAAWKQADRTKVREVIFAMLFVLSLFCLAAYTFTLPAGH